MEDGLGLPKKQSIQGSTLRQASQSRAKTDLAIGAATVVGVIVFHHAAALFVAGSAISQAFRGQADASVDHNSDLGVTAWAKCNSASASLQSSAVQLCELNAPNIAC